jgi:hypothetical protein
MFEAVHHSPVVNASYLVEEFEAIRDLAQKARAEQEDLTLKVAALEAKLAAMNGGPEKTRKPRKAATRPATKSAAKPAAKPATRRRTAEAKGAD